MLRNLRNLLCLIVLAGVLPGCDVFFPRPDTPAPAPDVPKPDAVDPDLGVTDPFGVRKATYAAAKGLTKQELETLYGASQGMADLLSIGKQDFNNSHDVTTRFAQGLAAAGWVAPKNDALKKALHNAEVAYKVDDPVPLAECKQSLIDLYRLFAAGIRDAYKEVAANELRSVESFARVG